MNHTRTTATANCRANDYLTGARISPPLTTYGTVAMERFSSPFSACVGGHGSAPETTAVSPVTTAMAPVSQVVVPRETVVVQGAPVIPEMMVQASVVAREVGWRERRRGRERRGLYLSVQKRPSRW